MATAKYGLAKLDLDGNRVIWDSQDSNHDSILLEGSHFHHIVPMATLAISALCLLSFLAILLSICCFCCGGRHRTNNFLPWGTVWIPIFSLIGFFAIDIANRIFHELERLYPTPYIAIDIVRGSLASIADGLLMIYLGKHSPVRLEKTHPITRIAMIVAIAVYSLISAASKGTQIWNLMAANAANAGSDSSGGSSDDQWETSMNIFQDLNTAASGMLVLFAIGFALLSFSYVRHLSRNSQLQKRKSFAVALLAASFLVRNIVMFVFTLIYSQYNEVAALGVQLLYMAFYGLLSVVIFALIVSIAAIREDEDSTTSETRYGQVMQTAPNEQDYNLHQYQEKPNVVVDTYQAPQGYNPYYHSPQR